MKKLTKTFNTITVRKGEDFVVSLPANPSTGYQWDLRITGGTATYVHQNFKPDSKAMGAAGMMTYTYNAKAGPIQITASYKNLLGRASDGQPLTFKVDVT